MLAFYAPVGSVLIQPSFTLNHVTLQATCEDAIVGYKYRFDMPLRLLLIPPSVMHQHPNINTSNYGEVKQVLGLKNDND
jgi:hypothetical protein